MKIQYFNTNYENRLEQAVAVFNRTEMDDVIEKIEASLLADEGPNFP